MFADKADGVSFSYPSDWVIKPQRTAAFRVMVGPEDGVQNCTLSTQSIPQLKGVSAENFIRSTSRKDIIDGAKQKGVDLKIIDFEMTRVGNRLALFYVGESAYQNMGLNIIFRSLNVMTKAEDRLYLISCTSLPGDIIKNAALYNGIIASLAVRF